LLKIATYLFYVAEETFVPKYVDVLYSVYADAEIIHTQIISNVFVEIIRWLYCN